MKEKYLVFFLLLTFNGFINSQKLTYLSYQVDTIHHIDYLSSDSLRKVEYYSLSVFSRLSKIRNNTSIPYFDYDREVRLANDTIFIDFYCTYQIGRQLYYNTMNKNPCTNEIETYNGEDSLHFHVMDLESNKNYIVVAKILIATNHKEAVWPNIILSFYHNKTNDELKELIFHGDSWYAIREDRKYYKIGFTWDSGSLIYLCTKTEKK